jgi:WD40 repeat protein
MNHPKVFISYSHDSPEHVDRVLSFSNRLRKDGIDCILDQYEPAPSEGWPRWTEKQVLHADFVLLVCTETYYKRVTGEEKPGVGRGVRWEGNLIYNDLYQNDSINFKFIPVLFQDCHDKYIPLSLKSFTYYWIDSDDDYNGLYRHLTNQFPKKPGLGKLKQLPPLKRHHDFFSGPFMAPNLPERFVSRPQLYDSILQLILNTDQQSPIAITTALHGAGGYGKTTLAAALCHDAKVQQKFCDGILWITLGTNPNVLEYLALLYFALTEEKPGFKDVHDASEFLATVLSKRHCLIVIDDVWEREDLTPFLRGGPNCVRLFTTRNFKLSCEGKRFEVDQMEDEEAIKLLVGQHADLVTDWRPLYNLAERLGNWPLLLELASKQMHYLIEGQDIFDNALQSLNIEYEQKGIVAFDADNPMERSEAVSKTIEISLERLDSEQKEAYLKLGIFPEDTDIPFATIGQLLGLDGTDTKRMLESFHNLGLLKLHLGRETIRLHDELLFYLKSKMDKPSAFHELLLNAWDDPYNLPNAYAWQYLAYHLKMANQLTHLRQLILDPVWLQLKLNHTGTIGLINDTDNFPDDRVIWYIRRVIQLSVHILAKDPTQFLSQFYGRLIGVDNEIIQDMLKRIKKENQYTPWLRSVFPFMESPESPVIFNLTGHSNMVKSVAITTDGKRVVSASSDQTLKVWDLETGSELYTLSGHSGGVNGVAVTPDGKRVLSASDDKTLKVWDLETGSELCTLSGHYGNVNAVTVTLDGKRAVSASEDQTLKIWNLETGKVVEVRTINSSGSLDEVAVTPDGKLVMATFYYFKLRIWVLKTGRKVLTLKGRSDFIRGIAVTPDGKRILFGREKTLEIWDLKTGRKVHDITGHSDIISGLAVTPDGKRVITASNDTTLKVWDLETGRELCTLLGHSDKVKGVAVTPDGKRAVSASGDKTLRVWDLETGYRVNSLISHSQGTNGVAIMPEGRRAVSTFGNGTLKVWDLESGSEVSALTDHSDAANGVAMTPDGKQAMSTSYDRILKNWNLENGRKVSDLTVNSVWYNGVAVNPDGKQAVSIYENRLTVWDLETRRVLKTLNLFHLYNDEKVYGVAVTPDGKQVIIASIDTIFKVWNLKTGRKLNRTLKISKIFSNVDDGEVVMLDGKRVVSSGYRTLTVWDLETGKKVKTISRHLKGAIGMAVTPDGKQVVSSSYRTLKVWDIDTGREVSTLIGHSDWVTGIAVTPDGKRAVSSSYDGTIRVWDLETKKEIITIISYWGRVKGMAVTPDGKWIVLASYDGTLSVWDLETKQCIITFTGDSPFSCCTFKNDNHTIIAGNLRDQICVLYCEGI